MAQSFRFVRRQINGRVPQNFNTPAIKSRQAVVHVTAAEIRAAPDSEVQGPAGLTTQNFMYFLGAANVWISNVAPHFNDHFPGEPGGVEFIINVDFPSPIDVGITITVEDQTPVDVQGL
ncbi:hypothetical protein ACFFWD_30935 [Bradyrhizobium erythrophlei]|uniref:hypothetical protein n=1 Tax=Bradyrhizobium erythrophlei TaxID=1437360 RepID=UPI0035EF752E